MYQMTKIRWAAGAFAACMSPWAIAAEPGVTPTAIVIGQTIALSGSLSEHGTAVSQGINAFLRTVNDAGGIHGRKVLLKTVDDGGDSGRAAENTQRLIGKDNVLAIFGGIEGGPCVASMKVATEARVPLIACMAGSPELRDPVNHYVFPVRAGHYDEFARIIDIAASFGYKRIGFVQSDSDTGRRHLANVRKLLAARGLDDLALVLVLTGKPDPKELAGQIVAAKLDAIFNHGSYGVFAEVLREVRQRGGATHFMAVNSGAAQLVRILGKDAKGLIFTQVVPYPWSRATALAREHQEAMQKYYPEAKLSFSSIEGAASAMLLVEALERAGGDVTRERLIKALEAMRDHDLGGMSVTYGPGNRTGSTFVDTVVVATDGRFVR